MSTSDLIASASLVVSLVALVIAIYAALRGNKNASAATVIALNEALRQAWERFLTATADLQCYQLADLLNLFELACGLELEGSLVGASGDLMRVYLDQTLRLLITSPIAKERVTEMLHDANTFAKIRRFLKIKPANPSIIIPPEWYEVT